MVEKFEFAELSLKGAYLIHSFYNSDDRGAFIKDYNIDIFRENGINYNLKETFYTVSGKGVIRAIHYQRVKQQAKLVRCIKGCIYDVIVDLRVDSPSFGKWTGVELTGDNHLELLVPEELCKNKFTVLAIYGIMAIRRYDHGRTNSYYAAIT